MMGSREENQPVTNSRPSTNAPKSRLALIPDNQGLFAFLKNEEKHRISPSFFSEMGLGQDIIKVTDAEPDICLEVFYALHNVLWPQIEKQSGVSLKDAWTNFIGGSIFKGVLCPPERLISKKKLKDIKRFLSEDQEEHIVFQDLDLVVKSIMKLKQKILDYPDQLLQKEEIIASLDLVEGFYQGYRDQVGVLVQSILEKEQMNVACGSEFNALEDLLEPKAVMMSEIFTGHWAYRIPRNKAQRILALDEHRRSIHNDLNEPSNHRVASLPEAEEPLVYFKANGNPALQPEKEFMLWSLFRHLKIPAPETGVLLLTNVFEGDSDSFYAVQASEAVSGKSAINALRNKETIFEEEAFVPQVIGALLTNPSDGSFKNFKYSPKYKTLIGIDNDMIFGPQLTEDDGDRKVSIMSVLYLLPSMDKPIPASIQTYFTTLDPDFIVLAWLHDLEKKNREYELLFARLSYQYTCSQYQVLSPQDEAPSLTAGCIQEKIKVDAKLFEFHKKPFSPRIVVSKNLLDSLLANLKKIERLLLDNFSVSPQALFNEISPLLGEYYHRLRLEFENPERALGALWEKRNEFGINYCYISSLFDPEELSNYSTNYKNSLDDELKESGPAEFFGEYRRPLASENRQTPLDSLIKRYNKRRINDLLDLQELLKELQFLMRENLTDSKSFRDVVNFWYDISKITEKPEIVQEIISILFNLQHVEMQWLLILEEYFLRSDKFPLESPSTIHGAFMKQRIFNLTEYEKEYIFDVKGHIKKNASLTGRSNVTYFPEKNPQFYLKQYLEWPGYEFASILFMRMLGITHLPYQDLIIINSKYPVLLTQKVDGDPVLRVWQDSEAFLKLDPFHTGLLIIAAMLINPEDGKEDNFILSPDGKYLIPIDNDHCFLPSTFQKGAFWNLVVNTALQTKTLLFCLDEMNKPISNEVKQHILSIDFDFFLKSWMEELIKVERRYNNLVDQEQQNAFLENGTVPRILFYERFIHNIYWKVNKIQDLLKSTSEQTPLDLLKAVEPFVARCYQDSFQHGNTLQSRFKVVTNKLYLDAKTALYGSRTSILNTRSMMNIINLSAKDLQNDETYHKMGPSGALKLLKQLIEERRQKRILEQDLLCELDDKNEGGIWATLFGNPIMESALKDFFTSPKEGLVLKGSKLITSSKLANLFAQAPDKGMTIRFLSLPESPFLTNKEIRILAKECPYIEYLNVSGCMKLEEIATMKGEWSLLARLEAKNCLNLQKLISYSPVKILRIETHQKIQIFIENCLLDIFAMTTKTNRFDFLLEKGDSFQINPPGEMMSPEHFLQSLLFEKEKFDKFFRSPKITIGKRSILSVEDLEIYVNSIDLGDSYLSKERIQKIVQLKLINLRNLKLSFCKSEENSILESLIQGEWVKLRSLNLSHNEISDEGLVILSRGNWPLLRTLNLGKIKMTLVGIKTIVDQSNWPQLKHLCLSENSEINDEALQILGKGNWPLLEILDLSSTGVTKKGLLDFTANLNWPNLKKLILPSDMKDFAQTLLTYF